MGKMTAKTTAKERELITKKQEESENKAQAEF
jgi:hypothetical protein